MNELYLWAMLIFHLKLTDRFWLIIFFGFRRDYIAHELI